LEIELETRRVRLKDVWLVLLMDCWLDGQWAPATVHWKVRNLDHSWVRKWERLMGEWLEKKLEMKLACVLGIQKELESAQEKEEKRGRWMGRRKVGKMDLWREKTKAQWRALQME
jgi:hypothetical protein